MIHASEVAESIVALTLLRPEFLHSLDPKRTSGSKGIFPRFISVRQDYRHFRIFDDVAGDAAHHQLASAAMAVAPHHKDIGADLRLALSLGAVRRSSFEQCGESVWDFARCSVGRTACRRCGRVGCANGSARLALQIGLGGNLIHPLPRAVDRRVNITQVLQRPLKCFAGLTLSRPWARSKSAKKAFVECITLCLTISKTGEKLQLNQCVINWRCGQSRANPSPPVFPV